MLRFKIADAPEEFEQIHRLNHRTFAGEIPQHAARPDGRLVDRFHDENLYAVALRDDVTGSGTAPATGRVVGMLALRGRRPFSLDGKLPDLDAQLATLPAHQRPCEVRLLALDPAERGRAAFRGLAEALLPAAAGAGYDLALISGTPRQARLYRHLGFEPFGPLVGDAAAPYQPMFLTPAALRGGGRAFRVPLPEPVHGTGDGTGDGTDGGRGGERREEEVNLLPGPVPLSATVRAALIGPERSHRDPAFRETFERLRDGLCTLAGAPRVDGADVQVMTGAGTAANDAVAGQLSLAPGPGLVLTNGEFGDRLVDHAARWRLEHTVHRRPWGTPFDPAAVRDALRQTGARWLWAVHGETSTGVLNDLRMLKETAAEAGASLAVDAVSSLGATPVDLAGVAWATSVSGKSLGGPPGLAFVFHAAPPATAGRLPRCLDLGLYAERGGIPFTLSSGLTAATAAAIAARNAPRRFEELNRLTDRLIDGLGHVGLAPIAREPRLPGVVTVAVPPPHSAGEWIAGLAAAGFRVNRSGYLAERGWMQFALIGRARAAEVDRLTACLRGLVQPGT